jgi:hypothetical protein
MSKEHRGRWAGAEVVCVASGPSLTGEDCEAVRCWREAGDDRRVVAINNTYQRAPWADVLYSGDLPWWDHYVHCCKAGEWPEFRGERWTQSALATRRHGIRWIRAESGEGLRSDRIFTGGNSGYQALQLAVLFGSKRVILLGYDLKKTGGRGHWHLDHPREMGNGTRHHVWAQKFDRLAPMLSAAGVEVCNATRETAIRLIPRVELGEALGALV